MNIEKELLAFEALVKEPIVSCQFLAGAGGDRKYCRLTLQNGKTVIGVAADNLDEAKAFINLSYLFRSKNINVPKIIGFSSDFHYYIEEDLGDVSLFDLIIKGEDVVGPVEYVMRNLATIQCIDRSEWNDIVVYKPVDRRQIMWDLNYFKYEFLKPVGIQFDEDALEDDFDKFATDLMTFPNEFSGLQMRDCQSRNIMMNPNPVFIDFQSARLGPGLYDAVSFLWQAKAAFTPEFREGMLDVYADEFCRLRHADKKVLLSYIGKFALFRTLQVLGAYGFRGLVQKRSHFIESIPGALLNLSELLGSGELHNYPELSKICQGLVSLDKFNNEKSNRLKVTVYSFSYKKGYPDDFTGNGGGFMFDCRGMHNPGRYDMYKPMTGMDKDVIDFLEKRGEVQKFVRSALDIVKPSIERYKQRGFSSLQIGFGCTGGRHRSVYCAESLARKIAAEYDGIAVELKHREQNIIKTLK